MQRVGQNTAVHQILKSKLEDVLQQHMGVLEAMEGHMTRVEEKVKGLISSENQSTEAALRLATYIDQICGQLTVCHQAISSIQYEADSTTAAQMSAMPASESTVPCGSSHPQGLTSASPESTAALNVLQIQVESLQQQVASLSESQNTNFATRLGDVETKLFLLERSQKSQKKKNIDIRLQNVEAKFCLVEEMQLKNGADVRAVVTDMTTLKRDIVVGQDEINRLELQQDILGERIQDVKNKTDNLVRLRNLLNHLHMNVTSRDELSKKVNQFQEEISKIQLELAKTNLKQLALDTVGDKKDQIMPVFVATAERGNTFQPKQVISFANEILNEWGAYDSASSKFTAPVEGLYFFSASINANSTGVFTAAIMHGNYQAALFASSGDKDEQASTSVFLRLAHGDDVWVEVEGQSTQAGVEIGGGFSNFIGCRIR